MTQGSEHRVFRQAASTRAVAQPGREEGFVSPDAHPVEHEHPEDWGWHGETGKWGRAGAWFAVVVLLLFMIGNHQGHVENLWILGIAGVMVVILIWDRFRRKNAWRAR